MASSSKTKAENSRFAPFIPALELSREDADALAREAQALVRRAVDEYQYYRTGAADWTKWKEVRRVDTLRVFRERQSITKNDIDSAGAPLLPEVLAIGNVSGTVEDMMFGAMAPTATAMLANSRCTDEGLSEARVMATLATPKVNDPFRSLSAKWFSFSIGSGMCSLRDCSILEATGVLVLENGERLGYVLRHSVSFRGVPDLQPFGVLRANLASWAIYRESGPGMVQCFVKSFHDLGAGTWKAMGLKSICERALALCKFVACAETKKLVRLLRSDGWDMLSARRARLSSDADCAVCQAPFSSSLLGSSARPCAVCRHAVCPHCLQKKTVFAADEDAQRVTAQQLRVCDTCADDARQPASLHLQVEEILARDDAAYHTGGLLKPSPSLLPFPFTASLTDSDASSESHF